MYNPFQRKQTGRTDLQIVTDHLTNWEQMLEQEQTQFSPEETEAEQAYLNYLRSEYRRLNGQTETTVQP